MFPITMSFTVANEQQLAKLVSAANDSTLPTANTIAAGVLNKPQDKAAEVIKTTEKKPDPAASEKGAAASPSIATEQASAQAQSAENSAAAQDSPDATIDTAKALTLKLVSAKGADFTRALLKEFNVPVAAKLAPEQVGPFVTRAQQALAA